LVSYLGGLMLDKLEKLTGDIQKEEDPWDEEAPVTKQPGGAPKGE